MKTLKKWLDKPWTNGTYVKLSAISIVLSWIFYMIAIKKIDRDFGITTVKKTKSKAKNENSLFDEVSTRDFRL